MREYCVAVADAARARLFTLAPTEFPELESGPRLVEEQQLRNTEQVTAPAKGRGSVHRGRNRAPGGASYAFENHHERHERDVVRRFAKQVAAETERLVRAHRARCLVLAADRRMLGLLRAELTPLSKNGLEIRECDKEMTGLKPGAIHEHLAKVGLLPPCHKPEVS